MLGRRWIYKLSCLLLALGASACKQGSVNNPYTSPPINIYQTSVTDYTSSRILVNLKGTPVQANLKAIDTLEIYTNSACSSNPVGTVLVADFPFEGINIELKDNKKHSLYVTTRHSSDCRFLIEYQPQVLVPRVPLFTRSSPESPSRESYTPGLFGFAFPLSGTVEFFTDSACSVKVGEGTAEEYLNVGVQVTLPDNTESTIYGRTLDTLGQPSACGEVTKYYHTDGFLQSPTFISISPNSPSKDSTTARVFGEPGPEATFITLYGDSACSQPLASGEPQDFHDEGFEIQVPTNFSTVIYAKSRDDTYNPSKCVYLTTYTHDSIPPDPPSYLSADPASPTRLTTVPKIKGESSDDTVSVAFFDSNLCLNQRGLGSKLDFETGGISVSLPENAITSIYAKSYDMAGNGSDCTYLTDYKHNTIPPDHPVFKGTTPESPTNGTITPLVYGDPSPTMVSLVIYADEQCQSVIGGGTSAEYENPGVQITVGANQITDFYARATDQEGNISECAILGSYDHSNQPADSPAFYASNPPSPSRISWTPWIIGVANNSFTEVHLYSDDQCTSEVGSGTGGSYGAGIPVTLAANSTTDIYAVSTDKYGNTSVCTYLTTYVHTNIPPENPVFTDVTPTSPNNSSFSPTLKGYSNQNIASQLPPSRVEFFDSLLCINKLGQGTPSQFNSTGITINVPPNTPNMIYGRSFDDAGNASSCVYLLNYTHNALKPAAPIFTGATPWSPSYTSETRLKGSYGLSTDFMNKVSVNIYSDASCTNELASGSPNSWETSGILTPLPLNQITSLFGASFNEVGTKSDCSALINFRHHDLPVTGLNVTNNLNGSVKIAWMPDVVASPNPSYSIERSLGATGPFSVIRAGELSTSFNDNAVTEGTTYYYRVFASNVTGRGQYSEIKSVTVDAPPPVDVASLTATPGSSAVLLAWSGFAQNMSYKVLRSQQEGGPFAQIASTSSGTYVDDDVINYQTYYYIVKGQNPEGVSVQSNMASAVPLPAPVQPLNLSLEPRRNMIECGGGNGVYLSWSSPSYYQNFEVLQGRNPFAKSQVQVVGSTRTTVCAFNSGTNNENHNYFSVRSKWGTTTSNESNIVGLYYLSSPPFSAYAGDEEIQLTWSVPSGGNPFVQLPARFDLYKSESYEGPFEKIVEDTQSLSYLDTDVDNGKAYFYFLQAYTLDLDDNIKEFVGWPSLIQSGVPGPAPSQPEQLKLTIGSAGEVRLDWAAPSHYNGFSVQRASAPGGPFVPVAWTTNPYLLSAPTIDGMNYFRVTARWGSQETAPTNVVSFRHASVLGLSAQVNGSDIDLSWLAVQDADDYEIFRSTTPLGGFASIGTSDSPSFTDSTTTEDVGYFYRVTARFLDGTSSLPSASVAVARGSSKAPKGLSLEVLPGSLIMARWVAIPGISLYEIYLSEALEGPYLKVGTTSATEHLIVSLDPATEYFVFVRSKQGANNFDCDPVSITTLEQPSPPQVEPGDGYVKLTWVNLPQVTDYDIERSTDGTSFGTVASAVVGTTYSDATVSNGTLYFYRLKANYPQGSARSGLSLGVRPGTIPKAPQGLTAANNNTGSQVELSWSPEAGATKYFIYRSSVSGSYGAPIQSSTSTNRVLVSGLNSGEVYYFKVSAVRGEVESGLSNEVSIVPGLNLAAPTAAMESTTEAKVSWAAVPGAATYDVYRTPDGGWFEKVGSSVAGTEFVDTIDELEVTYYYKYQPVSASGTLYPFSDLSQGVLLGIKPETPQGFVARAQNTTSIQLTWVSVPNVMSYQIYRGVSQGGPYSFLDDVPFTSTGYNDAAVSAGQEYFYVLRAVNASGVLSDETPEAGVNLIAAPTGLLATYNSGVIDLSWNATAGATNYIIRRSELSGGPYGSVGTSGATGFQDTAIEVDRTYYYVVEAVFASGSVSPHSSEATVLSQGSLSLVVPIELLDLRVASSSSAASVIDISQTRLNTSYYDGTVTYSLEILATNEDSVTRSVHLVNQVGTSVASIPIFPGTSQPKRISLAFNPDTGEEIYRLKLDQTTGDADVVLSSARVLVHQVEPTRTRIYFPLLGLSGDPANMGAAVSTSESTFGELQLAIPFVKDTSKFVRIIDFNAWEIEALVAASPGSEGSLAFVNRDTDAVLLRTQTTFDVDDITLARIPFSEGDLGFGEEQEGSSFELSLRCDLNCDPGEVYLYKAGLWLTLENLTKTAIHFRNAPAEVYATDGVVSELRSFVDRSKFSASKVYFEAVGKVSSGGSADVSLVSSGDDSGGGGQSDVVSSAISMTSEEKVRLRTATDLSWVGGEKLMTKVQVSAPDELSLTCSSLVVEVGAP